MTREGLIEVMARALCVDDGVDPDVVGYDRTGRDFPNWYVVQGTAETVLAALEAAGVRLVPSEGTPAMWQAAQMNSEVGEYVCSNWAGAYQCIEQLYRAMLAASPYAPQKEQTHESD